MSPAIFIPACSGDSPPPDVKERTTFVTLDHGIIAGFASVGPWRHFTSDHVYEENPQEGGEIRAIYVDPDHWRAGTGSLLLKAGLDWLHAEGLSPVRPWVLKGNESGMSFYRKNGFEYDGADSELRLQGVAHTEHRFIYQGA